MHQVLQDQGHSELHELSVNKHIIIASRPIASFLLRKEYKQLCGLDQSWSMALGL